jgi:thiol-disulfide isomerase/thioredoxin
MEFLMKSQRFLGLLIATALFIGCAQEKKGPTSGGSASSDQASTQKLPARSETNADKQEGGKATVEELMTRAQQALSKQDLTTAIAALEELVAAEPKNREGLLLLSRVLQAKGVSIVQGSGTKAGAEWWLKSAKYIKQLRSAYPKLTEQEAVELPAILYNEACVLALQGETEKAMAALEDAFNSGFQDLDLLTKDPDLDALRSLPAFNTLMKEALARLAAKAKEHARQLLAEHKPFDFDFALPDLDGKTVSRKDFAGKVLIVDIWGTWCPPCKKEIPHFVDLLKLYEDKGLKIVGINYEQGDAAEAPKTIREFAGANNMTYTCVIGDNKTRNQVPNFTGYPTTLFLDRAGKVRLSVVGYHPLHELEAIIKELL